MSFLFSKKVIKLYVNDLNMFLQEEKSSKLANKKDANPFI